MKPNVTPTLRPQRQTADSYLQNIPSLVSYFDLVRIINLGIRADRRAETKREFARHGWLIDGERLAFFEAITPKTAGGFPNSAVRGCYLSHLTVLEAALSESANHLLVLEDDIAFVRRIDSLGIQAVTQLDTMEWDLAYFGHAFEDLPGAPRWERVTGQMQHAHFYAANKQVLPRLIDFLQRVAARPPGHPEGGPMHYDGALSTFFAQNPDIRAFYFSRNLGYQRPSRTDLHPVSFLDRHPLLMPMRVIYRAIKRAYWHAMR